MTNVWQVESVTNGWAIYTISSNIEYFDEDGDNVFFETKDEAQWFVDGLNVNGELHKQSTLERLRTKTAIEMLEDADLVEEFDDFVWIKVDPEMWETFHNLARY